VGRIARYSFALALALGAAASCSNAEPGILAIRVDGAASVGGVVVNVATVKTARGALVSVVASGPGEPHDGVLGASSHAPGRYVVTVVVAPCDVHGCAAVPTDFTAVPTYFDGLVRTPGARQCSRAVDLKPGKRTEVAANTAGGVMTCEGSLRPIHS